MSDNPQNRGRWVGGLALIALGIIQIVSNNIDAAWEIWLWIVFLGAAAIGLGWVYTRGRETWALIVAYVAGALAVLLLVIEVIRPSDALIPTLVLLLVALPFVFAWSRDRAAWGLLVPAYVMLAIIPILYFEDSTGADNLIPAYVLAAIGLPFLVAFLRTRQIGFLIPAGILLVIAAVFLLDAIETAGPVINLLAALGLIVGGGYLLLRARADDTGTKAKRQD